MAEWDAELVKSIGFGLGVMILAVVSVLVIIGQVTKMLTARVAAKEQRDNAALVRRYEELAGEVRYRLARLESAAAASVTTAPVSPATTEPRTAQHSGVD